MLVLGKEKREFVPLDETDVRMYVCGPTVHDDIHIGNARTFVLFDLLYRLLRTKYSKVTYVRNITDVDDKIIKKQIYVPEVSASFAKDLRELGCAPPEFQPQVSLHIQEIIEFIEILLEKGCAYVNQGYVFFDTANSNVTGNKVARIEENELKIRQEDFILWKPCNDYPRYPSPWSEGRPGWHVECSAMADKYLGHQFDIHGGGMDLMKPHHQNEVLQTCSAFNVSFMASHWVHVANLMIDGKKMSKSTNNVLYVKELLNDYQGVVIRLALLQSHYMHPINWNKDFIEQLEKRYHRWGLGITSTEDYPNEFFEALEDNLNTPKAFHTLDKYLKEQPNKILPSLRFLEGEEEFNKK